MKFHFYKQLNAMDCGPACLKMVAKFYGRHYNLDKLRSMCGFGKEGVSLLGVREAAEMLGFRTMSVRLSFQELLSHATGPGILHWDQNHFVVLLPAGRGVRTKRIKIADPSKSIINYSCEEFKEHWLSSLDKGGEPTGTVLLLEPTANFYDLRGDKDTRSDWGNIFRYLKNCRWQIIRVFIALLVGSMLQLIFPFLTQRIVDIGIRSRDLHYITIILIAQFTLTFSRAIVDFIRTRMLMIISIIVSSSILSDFWVKVTALPLAYFDSHHTGDIMQRLNDNQQVQNFLTSSALYTAFSLFNFIIYAGALTIYSAKLFFVFACGSILYFAWIRGFLGIRRKLNYEIFHVSTKENNATVEFVQGMQEIKLHNAERQKRWEWENIQKRIFTLNLKSLNYNQVQQAGALLITQGKDLVIIFCVARMVVEGKLTLGAMLAIQYILGQLSGPIEQFIAFIQSSQDAKISMERLSEIHRMKNEEDKDADYMDLLPENRTIRFSSFCFTYPGTGNEPALEGIDLEIPQGKVTAIVGVSGSGKTTLLKILLKFYDSYSGEIMIGGTNFRDLSPSYWRRQCGAVLQDGYIFNDSIANNIAVGYEVIDQEKLVQCCKAANILTFIESLPNGFHTQLGAEGTGISQGQKQRLLIARAIYMEPAYFLFDEATNALDANNEAAIVQNMQDFFKGRTVIVVAHRLSTVKNADKIIVMHNGKITEKGTHSQLSQRKGQYFELVKNQLGLGG